MDSIVWAELGLGMAGVVISLVAFLAVTIFKDMADDIKRMADSVDNLNIRVAVVIEKTDNHERRIGLLEQDR